MSKAKQSTLRATRQLADMLIGDGEKVRQRLGADVERARKALREIGGEIKPVPPDRDQIKVSDGLLDRRWLRRFVLSFKLGLLVLSEIIFRVVGVAYNRQISRAVALPLSGIIEKLRLRNLARLARSHR